MTNPHNAAPAQGSVLKFALLAACALVLAGCASTPAADPRDPMEGFNRGVNSANRELDQAVLKPVAKAYDQAVPRLVRTGVSNFFANLGDPWSAVNSLLQLQPGDAAQNGMRFAFNTVFGFAGILDIASDARIERHKEDFGQTLAYWGVPAGPYSVLPLLGPSTLRDTAALPVDWAGDPLRLIAPVVDRNMLAAGRAVDLRDRLLPLDPMLDEAMDRYTFMRDAYLQHRNAQARGGGSDGYLVPSDDAVPHVEAGPSDTSP